MCQRCGVTPAAPGSRGGWLLKHCWGGLEPRVLRFVFIPAPVPAPAPQLQGAAQLEGYRAPQPPGTLRPSGHAGALLPPCATFQVPKHAMNSRKSRESGAGCAGSPCSLVHAVAPVTPSTLWRSAFSRAPACSPTHSLRLHWPPSPARHHEDPPHPRPPAAGQRQVCSPPPPPPPRRRPALRSWRSAAPRRCLPPRCSVLDRSAGGRGARSAPRLFAPGPVRPTERTSPEQRFSRF